MEDLFLPRATEDAEPVTIVASTSTSAASEAPEPRRRPWVWPVLGLLLALLVAAGFAAGLWLTGRAAAPSAPVVTQIPAAPTPLPATVESDPVEASTAPAPNPLPS